MRIRIKKNPTGSYDALEIPECNCGAGILIVSDMDKNVLKDKLKIYYSNLSKGHRTPIRYKIVEEDE